MGWETIAATIVQILALILAPPALIAITSLILKVRRQRFELNDLREKADLSNQDIIIQRLKDVNKEDRERYQELLTEIRKTCQDELEG